jgi:hypothetical protein
MAPPAPPVQRRGIRRRWIVLGVVILALLAIGAYAAMQRDQAYATGHAAYLRSDCASAVGPLTEAGGSSSSTTNDVELKARAELQECQALLAAADLDTQGKQADAVLAYSEVVTKYPRSPLQQTALASGQRLVTGTPADRLATAAVCADLETLEAQRFVDATADALPSLLHACGNTYFSAGAYADALLVYERFRTEFPDHGLSAQVDEGYAAATLAEAAASGAGALPQPESVGGSGEGALVTVIIRNDSPERLTIVFSGPEVRVELLPACVECERFVNEGPPECPEKGPIGRYVVEPGTYTVVVKATAGNSVTPFRGTWTLEASTEYSECFFLVTQGA